MMLSSYPSIYAVGHRAVREIFSTPVVVQEKIDGSQISFGVFKGELFVRSKGAQIHVQAPDSMFKRAVETVLQLRQEGKLTEGWTYRGEYLSKPKHNALAYDRVPMRNIILFDIEIGLQTFLLPEEVRTEANALGLEVVPTFSAGHWTLGKEGLLALLEKESCLGGAKVEGVVIKNYELFGTDKHVLMAKFVSEDFKEVHRKVWGGMKEGKGDIIERLIAALRTEARWQKAIIHLWERGQITDSPKDIGLLIPAVRADIEKEETEWIKDQLYKHFAPQIMRGAVGGLAEWYKRQLLDKQFATTDAPVEGTV